MASRPGVPIPIKLQSQHRPLFPLDKPITRETGRRLAEWARGGSSAPTGDRDAVLGDLKRSLEKYGYGGAEDAEVKKRQALLVQLLGTSSWKAIEALDVEKIRAGVKALREQNEPAA
jgi:hypothetical protein